MAGWNCELASVAVVWGRCPEHVEAPPLWPWEQMLRAVNARWPDRPVPDPVAELLSGGSVAYFTGEAALALGDPDAALADFAIAVETDEQMGALPWLAQARNAITRAQRMRAKPTLRGRQVR